VSIGQVVAGVAFDTAGDEVTITRMIGNIFATLEVGTVSADRMAVAIGMIIVRNEAVTAGVASLPSPRDDADAEWLYWAAFQLDATLIALNPDQALSHRIHYDVRGQRVLRAGSTPVWIAQAGDDAASGATARIFVNGRYLVKLA